MENVILIGMPGAGKSTGGVVLAKRMGYRFIDSDLVIQEHYDKLLQELIEEYGTEGFWAIEDEINSTIKGKKTVIATGGSAVYGEKAMKNFRRIGTVVYLKLPYEEIAERLGDLHARGVTVREGQSLKDLYEERLPLYERYAHISIDCEGKALREIVIEICEKLAEEESGKGTARKAKSGSDVAADSEKTPSREILKDKDIREPLFTFLEETYGKMRIIEEKTVGKSRADVVMILQDSLVGIEIKSDADTYARLADQVKDYDQYFDYNYVVVGTTHGEHVPEHVPA